MVERLGVDGFLELANLLLEWEDGPHAGEVVALGLTLGASHGGAHRLAIGRIGSLCSMASHGPMRRRGFLFLGIGGGGSPVSGKLLRHRGRLLSAREPHGRSTDRAIGQEFVIGLRHRGIGRRATIGLLRPLHWGIGVWIFLVHLGGVKRTLDQHPAGRGERLFQSQQRRLAQRLLALPGGGDEPRRHLVLTDRNRTPQVVMHHLLRHPLLRHFKQQLLLLWPDMVLQCGPARGDLGGDLFRGALVRGPLRSQQAPQNQQSRSPQHQFLGVIDQERFRVKTFASHEAPPRKLLCGLECLWSSRVGCGWEPFGSRKLGRCWWFRGRCLGRGRCLRSWSRLRPRRRCDGCALGGSRLGRCSGCGSR